MNQQNDIFQRPLLMQDMKNGEVMEIANSALQAAHENMLDLNTDWKKSRSITLKITLKCQDEDREQIIVAAEVASKLAPVRPMLMAATIGRERVGEKMKAVAYELATSNPDKSLADAGVDERGEYSEAGR